MLPVLHRALPPPNGSAGEARPAPVPDRLTDPLMRWRVGERLDFLQGPIGSEALDRLELDKLLRLVGIPESARFAATDRRRDGNLGERPGQIDSRPDGMPRPRSQQERRVFLRSPADRVLSPIQARVVAIRNSLLLFESRSLPFVYWSFESPQPVREYRLVAIQKSLHAQCLGLLPSHVAFRLSLDQK